MDMRRRRVIGILWRTPLVAVIWPRRPFGGTARHYTYTANYDGKDSPIVGNNPNGDTIARTRVDAMTTKSVTKKGGKVATSLTTVTSPDGKTRTNTTTGTDGMGMAVSSVAVYDRQ